MVVFEGKIEAVIKEDHPKCRYGEMPDGFESLTLSPSKRYAAEVVKVPRNVADGNTPNFMLRVVDLTKQQFRYFWIDYQFAPRRLYRLTTRTVIWLNENSLLLVFDKLANNLILINVRIDHDKSDIVEVWKREVQLTSTFLDISKSVIKVNNEEYIAVLINTGMFAFIPISHAKAQAFEIKCPRIVYFEEKELLVGDFGFEHNGSVYLSAKDKDDAQIGFGTHLIRLDITNIDLKNSDWLVDSAADAVISKMPEKFAHRIALTGNWIVFKKYNNNTKQIALNTKDFTCKTLSVDLDSGEDHGKFLVCYDNSVFVFNHFEDRPYPMKDSPLKYRFHLDVLALSQKELNKYEWR